MYEPYYSITDKILTKIAHIEYTRAVVENSTILPTWKQQIVARQKASKIYYSLKNTHPDLEIIEVKAFIEGYDTSVAQVVKNINNAYTLLEEIPLAKNLSGDLLKEIHMIICNNLEEPSYKGKYRHTEDERHLPAERILAEITRLVDWYRSDNARSLHPIISSAILRLNLEHIKPFITYNSQLVDILVEATLKQANYGVAELVNVQRSYYENAKEYETCLNSYVHDETMSPWLEYICKTFFDELREVQEEIIVLEQNTKIARSSGKHRLSSRQEKIVSYLSDYGNIQNKDFSTIFRDVSEDTVLRDLKYLIEKGIVTKRGKTKSAVYELS